MRRCASSSTGPSQAACCCSAAALVALVWSNSPWSASYFELWSTPLTLSLAGFTLSLSLHDWINDGLMALFFLVVGLEIKRELLVGELASKRRAVLPVAAAIGGALLPALIYVVIVGTGRPETAGWGFRWRPTSRLRSASWRCSVRGSRSACGSSSRRWPSRTTCWPCWSIAIFYTVDLSMDWLAVSRRDRGDPAPGKQARRSATGGLWRARRGALVRGAQFRRPCHCRRRPARIDDPRPSASFRLGLRQATLAAHRRLRTGLVARSAGALLVAVGSRIDYRESSGADAPPRALA